MADEALAAEAAQRETEPPMEEIRLESEAIKQPKPMTEVVQIEFASAHKMERESVQTDLAVDLAFSKPTILPRKYKPLYTCGIAGEGLASAGLYLYMNSGRTI